MSRSFKKHPFMAITGAHSAKEDKKWAHRGVRRAHNRVLARAVRESDFEDVILPHMRECRWNNVYCWSRDGRQHYMVPSARDYCSHCLSKLPGYEYLRHRRETWPPPWYAEMMRK